MLNAENTGIVMQVKVCGMRDADNIAAIGALPVDMLGFIFFEKSPRFCAAEAGLADAMQSLPKRIRKVGVFVNESLDGIALRASQYPLDMLQLHGCESPQLCSAIKAKLQRSIIKAFPIASANDFAQTKAYVGVADYFLFDTKTEKHGGSGKKFDWRVLQSYCERTPFFLSGGLQPDDVEALQSLVHPCLYAVDVNSGFEVSAGRKDEKKVSDFIVGLRRDEV